MDEDAGAAARFGVGWIVHCETLPVMRDAAHILAVHFAPDEPARGDGVIGRRRRIVDADGIGGEPLIAWPWRRAEAETAADAIDAGGGAAVAFDLPAFAVRRQMLEADPPSHAGAAEQDRFWRCRRLPLRLRRGALEEPCDAGS
jgi:hypothetical protein